MGRRDTGRGRRDTGSRLQRRGRTDRIGEDRIAPARGTRARGHSLRVRIPLVLLTLALVTLGLAGGRASAVGASYREEVLVDGRPAGYWRLGETSGTTAADATANANNGSYLQAVTLGVTGALASDGNTAARLDGGSGRISMGDPASGVFDFGTDDFTVEAWVKTSFNDEHP